MGRTSNKRTLILDAAEQLLLEQGYAAVTYRAVAAAAGVVPGLVQYYFPSQDELFIALLQRNTDQVIQQLEHVTEAEQPLRTIWRYASSRRGSTLLMEFMALANHRKAVAAEMGRGGDRVRRAQLAALEQRWAEYGLDRGDLTPAALLFMMNALPRMALLEQAFGTKIGHADTIRLIEDFLDRVEPRKQSSRARRASATG